MTLSPGPDRAYLPGMDEHLEERDFVIQLTDREDGGVRVRCPELPGILIGGSDPHSIWALVGDVVARAASNTYGLDVRRVIGPMNTPTTRGDIVLRVQHAPVTTRVAA